MYHNKALIDRIIALKLKGNHYSDKLQIQRLQQGFKRSKPIVGVLPSKEKHEDSKV